MSYIVVAVIGVAVGFGLALLLNHKKADTFDRLTDKADKVVDKAREKL